MKQHLLSRAFPKMEATDSDALLADIEKNGQRDPITIFEGEILDGWHRWQICEILGRKPLTVELPGDVDPRTFVLSKNLHRRHLSASQRAVAVAACNDWRPRGGSVSMATESPLAGVSTNKELAITAGVSVATIKDAKAVIKAGREEEVKSGAASVKSIARPEKPEKKKPAPAPVVVEDDMEDVPDFSEIAKEQHEQIQKQEELIKSLSASDAGQEIAVLKGKFDSVCGRVNQLLTTQKELEKTATYRGKLLDKIREALGVKKDGEILAAIKALQ
jgi:hypothetical protein